MCYTLASKNLLFLSLECGPARDGSGMSLAKDETKNIQDSLITVVPQMSPHSVVFRPSWVRKNGILYQANNTFLITGSDGLDPIFGFLIEMLVVGGDMLIFVVTVCHTQYFDNHYHAFTVSLTSQQSLTNHLLDVNVYHGHKLVDQQDIIYVPLKYHIL